MDTHFVGSGVSLKRSLVKPGGNEVKKLCHPEKFYLQKLLKVSNSQELLCLISDSEFKDISKFKSDREVLQKLESLGRLATEAIDTYGDTALGSEVPYRGQVQQEAMDLEVSKCIRKKTEGGKEGYFAAAKMEAHGNNPSHTEYSLNTHNGASASHIDDDTQMETDGSGIEGSQNQDSQTKSEELNCLLEKVLVEIQDLSETSPQQELVLKLKKAVSYLRQLAALDRVKLAEPCDHRNQIEILSKHFKKLSMQEFLELDLEQEILSSLYFFEQEPNAVIQVEKTNAAKKDWFNLRLRLFGVECFRFLEAKIIEDSTPDKQCEASVENKTIENGKEEEGLIIFKGQLRLPKRKEQNFVHKFYRAVLRIEVEFRNKSFKLECLSLPFNVMSGSTQVGSFKGAITQYTWLNRTALHSLPEINSEEKFDVNEILLMIQSRFYALNPEWKLTTANRNVILKLLNQQGAKDMLIERHSLVQETKVHFPSGEKKKFLNSEEKFTEKLTFMAWLDGVANSVSQSHLRKFWTKGFIHIFKPQEDSEKLLKEILKKTPDRDCVVIVQASMNRVAGVQSHDPQAYLTVLFGYRSDANKVSVDTIQLKVDKVISLYNTIRATMVKVGEGKKAKKLKLNPQFIVDVDGEVQPIEVLFEESPGSMNGYRRMQSEHQMHILEERVKSLDLDRTNAPSAAQFSYQYYSSGPQNAPACMPAEPSGRDFSQNEKGRESSELEIKDDNGIRNINSSTASLQAPSQQFVGSLHQSVQDIVADNRVSTFEADVKDQNTTCCGVTSTLSDKNLDVPKDTVITIIKTLSNRSDKFGSNSESDLNTGGFGSSVDDIDRIVEEDPEEILFPGGNACDLIKTLSSQSSDENRAEPQFCFPSPDGWPKIWKDL